MQISCYLGTLPNNLGWLSVQLKLKSVNVKMLIALE